MSISNKDKELFFNGLTQSITKREVIKAFNFDKYLNYDEVVYDIDDILYEYNDMIDRASEEDKEEMKVIYKKLKKIKSSILNDWTIVTI